jgi:hypothetical protein
MANSLAVVLAEARYRLEVGSQTLCQPHQFDVALRFSFEPPARLDPIEIAVNVELQEHGGMVSGPARFRSLDTFEAKAGQVQLFDENVDHTYRVVLCYVIVQELGQQRTLSSILAFDTALHVAPVVMRYWLKVYRYGFVYLG